MTWMSNPWWAWLSVTFGVKYLICDALEHREQYWASYSLVIWPLSAWRYNIIEGDEFCWCHGAELCFFYYIHSTEKNNERHWCTDLFMCNTVHTLRKELWNPFLLQNHMTFVYLQRNKTDNNKVSAKHYYLDQLQHNMISSTFFHYFFRQSVLLLIPKLGNIKFRT